MAKRKKKGPAPKSNEPVKRRLSVSQKVFYVVGILVVLSMVIPLLFN